MTEHLTVAFLGLGHMGGPMATNLVAAKHAVRGFDPVPAALSAATEAGVTGFGTATDAVAAAEAAGVQIPAVLADVLYAMHGVDRMHTTTLLARLTNMDEDTYAEFTPERLAEQLEQAGVRRTSAALSRCCGPTIEQNNPPTTSEML